MHRAGLNFGIFVLMLGLVAGVLPQRANAHPHVWIDLRSQLEFDGYGRVTGLEIDWTFDEFYTAFVITEFGGPEAMDEETLTGIGRENLTNLREFDYFTEFLVDGAVQPLAAPETFEMGLEDGKLRLRFSVPLERPVIPVNTASTTPFTIRPTSSRFCMSMTATASHRAPPRKAAGPC